MKLCLLTYNLARAMDLTTLIQVARRCGYSALELRTDMSHAHGVEVVSTAAERRAIRDRIEDAYLEVACVGTGFRFESPDSAARAEQVTATERAIDLAADLGCTRVRVFGNNLPTEVPRDDCVRYVGESLRTLGEYAAPRGVDVLLEMHGQFNYWGFARGAVAFAAHPRVGLVYNCDQRDVVGSSVAAVYSRVRDLVRHVHLHDFSGAYPYPELFDLLRADGYSGYLSSEIEMENPIPTVEQYLAMYSALFRAWAGQPFHAIGEA
jgi:sugar phosphate isomerase/epimerase